MRLSKQQEIEILETISSFVQVSHSVYLVGSRTKDHLKGGDIDLLLLIDDKDVDSLNNKKRKIINAIMAKPSIDETKTDLILATTEDLLNDPFISSLNKTKILLSTTTV